MKRVLCVALAVMAAAALYAAAVPDGKRWWSYVEALANDDMKGRNTGSPEHLKAAEYVAAEFARLNIKPAGEQGFIQPVKFKSRKLVESGCSLELIRSGKAERLTLGEDAIIGVRVDPAESVEARLVFAGYGLVVPEAKFDDFAGLDLRGKIIVTIAGGPSDIAPPLKSHYQFVSERARFLKQAGVAGMVTIQNPRTADIPWSRMATARFQEAMSLADPTRSDDAGLKIGITMNPEHADQWFAGSGHDLKELLALVDVGKPLPRFPLRTTLRAKVKVERHDLESQNVVGVRPGSDASLKNEYVVLSAHLDHVGVGEPINGDRIYNGAMDDASGVASLLDIAAVLNENKTQTKRSLLFVAVTGEEKGLLGSRYFAAHPTVPLSSLVADINMDMFLPLYPLHLLTVWGLGESDLGDLARRVSKSLDVEVQDDPQPQRNVFIRSDQYSFIRKGVPSLMMAFGAKPGSKEEQIAKTWLTNRYHAPSDDLNQPVDLKAAGQYNRLMMTLAEAVANSPARPKWKADSFFRRFAQ
jgi:hypothetical protein